MSIQVATATFSDAETAAITYTEPSGSFGYLMGMVLTSNDPPAAAPWIETSSIITSGATVSMPAAFTGTVTVLVVDEP